MSKLLGVTNSHFKLQNLLFACRVKNSLSLSDGIDFSQLLTPMETENSYKPCDVKSKPPDPGYAQSRWEKFPPFGSVLGRTGPC